MRSRVLTQDVRKSFYFRGAHFRLVENFDSKCYFSGWTKDVIDNEIDFAISKIKYAIDNESVWNYLRAIIKHDLLQYEKGTY